MKIRALMVIVVAGLLTQLVPKAPISASVGVNSFSLAGQILAQKAHSHIKQGDRLMLKHRAPYFNVPLSAKSTVDSFSVYDIGQPGETFSVQAVAGELVALQDMNRGTFWVPIWYTTEASSRIQNTTPTYVSMRPEAKLALTPGGSLKWSDNDLSDREQRISVARWDDWYGVIATPAEWRQDYDIKRPVLLWVNEKNVIKHKEISVGLFERGSTVPTTLIKDIVDLQLEKGVPSEEVAKLLGQPVVREASGIKELRGEALNLGETWRYERPDGHYIVSFTAAGNLELSQWIFPANDKPVKGLQAGNAYHYTYDFTPTPLPATIELPSVWRNQGDLAYAYLVGATDDVLVINGDDGWYSGMHDDSSLYAIHRQTGQKLWQVDAGYGMLYFMMGDSDEAITVYTSLNKEKSEYEDRIRHIRLKDGHVLWEVKPDLEHSEQQIIEIHGVKNSVLIINRPSLGDKLGSLVVLDRNTGKQKWKRSISGDFRVLNVGADDPYVLIQEGNLLQARDPNSGKVAWSMESKVSSGDDPNFYSNYAGGPRIDPFARENTLERWLLHGNQWLLVDLATGQEAARFPAKAGERFEVLNEQYLLIQRPLPGHFKKTDKESYESVLYDALAGKELWTVQGKATKGVIDGQHLYFVIEGIPAKAELKTGRIAWKIPVPASLDMERDLSFMAPGSYVVLNDYLLLSYGDDLLVLDKEDGHMAGRIQDVRMGYAELREQVSRNGLLNRTGDELYAGSANGAFTRFSVKMLEQRLEGLGKQVYFIKQ
ncbi:PQQ-binding-like beta-propeller repeat protein [Paenibacillus lentus]|uniref:Pyrrolo-quinoline quinone repeat domain-containing protein n=1 Tax=Paenibacillus lentus TaxID=1338368 RepID=A0A3S8RZQ2_9BACL|nr:PQQ-binding-like beta-propeller repeat protein [Paenibacillus lentus]AZK48431.1 hypothetical protein EIM92_21505 [Paenibacillus lentus]